MDKNKLTTQPTNSIDSEIEEKCNCKPLNDELNYTGDCPIHQVKSVVTMENLRKSRNPEAKAIIALIESEYVSRKELEEAIGEDEVFINIPIIDGLGNTTEIVYGESYTPIMIGRNRLRATLRAKLLPPTKGGNE